MVETINKSVYNVSVYDQVYMLCVNFCVSVCVRANILYKLFLCFCSFCKKIFLVLSLERATWKISVC